MKKYENVQRNIKKVYEYAKRFRVTVAYSSKINILLFYRN